MNKENKYIVEIKAPTTEFYRITSDVPLTKDEVIARVKNKNTKPDEIDTNYDGCSPRILVIEGTLEKEKTDLHKQKSLFI